ncbi:hypothetical protein OOT00_06725 [Desulfobotulus sp. H1]|uniref:Uncharacterized protein n=1 Tax=Desulfobotulus pelophilus TaxID=2823377 RepID=A0ABT3N9K0_9BACT|nr:hypothetical protein [Desulfobotulus pelophilus]MCW7753677.1 hypothetical protein [Desulfobotulus pelophilus]
MSFFVTRLRFLPMALLFLLAASTTALCQESEKIPEKNEKGIYEGMPLSEVRNLLGMPRNITRTEWRYPDLVILIENQQVACVISPSCIGKWANCQAYRTRSPECLLP